MLSQIVQACTVNSCFFESILQMFFEFWIDQNYYHDYEDIRKYLPPLQGRVHACQGPQIDHWPVWGGGVVLAGAGQGGRSMHMISSWSCPTQTRPPNAGAGFVQVRRRVFIAKPQVWEHADQADQAVQPPWTVQFVTLTRVPVQLSPPCCGGGLLHSLVWHWHVSIFYKSNFQLINFMTLR